MEFFALGKFFSLLSKRYAGIISVQLKDTPVAKHFIPLYIISKNNGCINQQQLANHLMHDKVCMVRIIDCLCERGLVERTVNPSDRREHLLRLTEEGNKWGEHIKELMRQANELFLSFLPENEREPFFTNLKNLTEAITELPYEDSEAY